MAQSMIGIILVHTWSMLLICLAYLIVTLEETACKSSQGASLSSRHCTRWIIPNYRYVCTRGVYRPT